MLDKIYKGEFNEFQKFAIKSRVDVMNKTYKEAFYEQWDFVFIETDPRVDIHIYSRTVSRYL